MYKLEEYIDEDCRLTLNQMRDRLLSDLNLAVSKTTVHRALQGMLYSVKQLRVEKSTMNNSVNKNKRMAFAKKLHGHITSGDMVIYHDENNFNLYLSRTQGWAPVGQHAATQLPPSQGDNLHIIGGVSSGTGVVLLKTHNGAIHKEENARFVADLFVAALNTHEYRELPPTKKIVIVTDNAPAHSGVEERSRALLVADGIMNGHKLVICRLARYCPMLNPIEGCWSVLKAKMRQHMAERKELFLVRGDYDTLTEHHLALMREAIHASWHVITQRLVIRMERHCARACVAAERGEDMVLGL